MLRLKALSLPSPRQTLLFLQPLGYAPGVDLAVHLQLRFLAALAAVAAALGLAEAYLLTRPFFPKSPAAAASASAVGAAASSTSAAGAAAPPSATSVVSGLAPSSPPGGASVGTPVGAVRINVRDPDGAISSPSPEKRASPVAWLHRDHVLHEP